MISHSESKDYRTSTGADTVTGEEFIHTYDKSFCLQDKKFIILFCDVPNFQVSFRHQNAVVLVMYKLYGALDVFTYWYHCISFISIFLSPLSHISLFIHSHFLFPLPTPPQYQ